MCRDMARSIVETLNSGVSIEAARVVDVSVHTPSGDFRFVRGPLHTPEDVAIEAHRRFWRHLHYQVDDVEVVDPLGNLLFPMTDQKWKHRWERAASIFVTLRAGVGG